MSAVRERFPLLNDSQLELATVVLRRAGYTLEIGNTVITDPNWFGRAVGSVMNDREVKESSGSSGMRVENAEYKVVEVSEEAVLLESDLAQQLSVIMKMDLQSTKQALGFMVDLSLLIPIEKNGVQHYLIPARLKRKKFAPSGVSNGQWFGTRFSLDKNHRFLPGVMSVLLGKLHYLARDLRVSSLLKRGNVTWGHDQIYFDLSGVVRLLVEMEDDVACNHIDLIALVDASNTGALEWLSDSLKRVREAIDLTLKGMLKGSSERVNSRPLCPDCLSRSKRVSFDKEPDLGLKTYYCLEGKHSVAIDKVLLAEKPLDPPDRSKFPAKLEEWSASQVREWLSCINPIHQFGLDRLKQHLKVAVDGKWLIECDSESKLEQSGMFGEPEYRRLLFLEIQELRGVVKGVRVRVCLD